MAPFSNTCVHKRLLCYWCQSQCCDNLFYALFTYFSPACVRLWPDFNPTISSLGQQSPILGKIHPQYWMIWVSPQLWWDPPYFHVPHMDCANSITRIKKLVALKLKHIGLQSTLQLLCNTIASEVKSKIACQPYYLNIKLYWLYGTRTILGHFSIYIVYFIYMNSFLGSKFGTLSQLI